MNPNCRYEISKQQIRNVRSRLTNGGNLATPDGMTIQELDVTIIQVTGDSLSAEIDVSRDRVIISRTNGISCISMSVADWNELVDATIELRKRLQSTE